MTDSYAEICGAAKYTLEVPGQGLITCTVPFSTRLNAGEDLFSCEFESLIATIRFTIKKSSNIIMLDDF